MIKTVELIKKYQNRKLYSTKLSRYVDLEYILDLVKTDQKFLVMDNKTKQDVTTDIIKSGVLNTMKLDRNVLVKLVKGE